MAGYKQINLLRKAWLEGELTWEQFVEGLDFLLRGGV